MAAREAARRALELAREIFTDEKISNLGLEEVDYNDQRSTWLITVGFSRPWDYRKKETVGATWMNPLLPADFEPQPEREYKIVELDADTLELRAIKNRENRVAIPA